VVAAEVGRLGERRVYAVDRAASERKRREARLEKENAAE